MKCSSSVCPHRVLWAMAEAAGETVEGLCKRGRGAPWGLPDLCPHTEQMLEMSSGRARAEGIRSWEVQCLSGTMRLEPKVHAEEQTQVLGLQPWAETRPSGFLHCLDFRLRQKDYWPLCAREWLHLIFMLDHFGRGSIKDRVEQGKTEGQREQLGGRKDHRGERWRETAERPASLWHCTGKYRETWSEPRHNGCASRRTEIHPRSPCQADANLAQHSSPSRQDQCCLTSSASWPAPCRGAVFPHPRSHWPSLLIHLLLALGLPGLLTTTKLKAFYPSGRLRSYRATGNRRMYNFLYPRGWRWAITSYWGTSCSLIRSVNIYFVLSTDTYLDSQDLSSLTFLKACLMLKLKESFEFT